MPAAPATWGTEEIRAVFDRGSRGEARLSGGHGAELAMLHRAVARPEFQPFEELLVARIVPTAHDAWRLAPDGAIELGPAAVRNPTAAAFHMRHALEFALLGRLLAPGPACTVEGCLRELLALHTALTYYLQMTREERATVRAGAGTAIAQALLQAESGDILGLPPRARCDAVAELAATIAGNEAPPDAVVVSAACDLAAPLLVAAQTAERLLTLGGDDRLLVSGETGLNGYGCSPRPRPWAITFSSSTASSISGQAYGEVEKMRREMLGAGLAGRLDDHLNDLCRTTRLGIAAILGVDAALADVALTASGTDAELIALWLAMGLAPHRAVLNVIVGPDEVGSGSVPAAGGRHFSPQSPLGGVVEPGTLVSGFPTGRIRVEVLPVRDSAGQPLPARAGDAALGRLVEDAVGRDETVLLHLVDCSKTGLMSPELDTVQRLAERYPEHLVVVVDAAQMRLSRAMLRLYLQRGFIVLVTGSKFFTGPPFSGAVLIPEATRSQLGGLVALPAGIAAYATTGDFSSAFREQTAQLPRTRNVGLVARWRAALWEMAAFYEVPAFERRRTIAAFNEAVHAAIARLHELELFCAPARVRIPDGGWDALPSIFTFLIRRAPGTSADVLGYDDGRRVYRWLNCDVSAWLSPSAGEEDLRLARRCCHTPQPVRIARAQGGVVAGMRVAAGARLVSGVHFDPGLGATAAQRLAAELSDMETVLRKAAMIARRWDDFADRGGEPPVTRP